METRKSFIIKTIGIFVALMLASFGNKFKSIMKAQIKTKKPRRALIFWYSQTGHTARIGKIIAGAWRKKGIKADAGDYRSIDKNNLINYDLIVAGTPVHYLDVPINLREWLGSIPFIKGIPVAGYATFGGHGDNQHNTACTLLDFLSNKGGIPVAMELFSNMSTYAPTWSMGNEKRILKYKHLPDENTYRRAREFAGNILMHAAEGKRFDINTEFTINTFFKKLPQIGFSKLLIGTHTIDKDKCILCRTCEKNCPANAIHPDIRKIDKDKCLLCFACINNCPASAVVMTFLGKKVYGFNEFLSRNKIVIAEPEEL